MGCLFCDQTPESVDAREKLQALANVIGCGIGDLMKEVHRLRYQAQTLEWERRQTQEIIERLRQQLRDALAQSAGYTRDHSLLPERHRYGLYDGSPWAVTLGKKETKKQ